MAPCSTAGGSRTPNPWFWRPVLCRLSYRRVCRTQAPAGIRTPGLVLTMDALCLLSYGSVRNRRAERSGPCCRAAPAPAGVACHDGGAGDGRRARPLRSRNHSREPIPELSNTPDRAGPLILLMPAGPFHRGRREPFSRVPQTRSAPPPTCGRRGARSCRAPGPKCGYYVRNGPPPASCAESCLYQPRMLDRVPPPNRSLPFEPPRRPPRAGAFTPPSSNPHG